MVLDAVAICRRSHALSKWASHDQALVRMRVATDKLPLLLFSVLTCDLWLPCLLVMFLPRHSEWAGAPRGCSLRASESLAWQLEGGRVKHDQAECNF